MPRQFIALTGTPTTGQILSYSPAAGAFTNVNAPASYSSTNPVPLNSGGTGVDASTPSGQAAARTALGAAGLGDNNVFTGAANTFTGAVTTPTINGTGGALSLNGAVNASGYIYCNSNGLFAGTLITYGKLLQFSNQVGLTSPSMDSLRVLNGAGTGDGNVSAASLIASGPCKLGSYTVATVPSVSSYSGYYIDVSNASGGAGLYRSNGTAWLKDGTSTVLS